MEEHLRMRATNVNLPKQTRDRIREQVDEIVELITGRMNKRTVRIPVFQKKCGYRRVIMDYARVFRQGPKIELLLIRNC